MGPKSKKQLRTFGFAFGSGLTVMGSALYYFGKPAAPWVLGAAATILLSAAVAPTVLRPLEWLLSKLVWVVMTAMTYVVLTISYFLVLTPIGLLMRLTGKRPLGVHPDPKATSYWIDVPADGPASRPDKPY